MSTPNDSKINSYIINNQAQPLILTIDGKQQTIKPITDVKQPYYISRDGTSKAFITTASGRQEDVNITDGTVIWIFTDNQSPDVKDLVTAKVPINGFFEPDVTCTYSGITRIINTTNQDIVVTTSNNLQITMSAKSTFPFGLIPTGCNIKIQQSDGTTTTVFKVNTPEIVAISVDEDGIWYVTREKVVGSLGSNELFNTQRSYPPSGNGKNIARQATNNSQWWIWLVIIILLIILLVIISGKHKTMLQYVTLYNSY